MLAVQNLHTSYGGIRALRGVSFSVAEGEMVALVGSNGAGKSTLLNTISGVVKPRSGNVRFDGVEIGGEPGWRVARRGLLQVPEGRQVVGEMTIRDNLLMGLSALRARPSAFTLDSVHELFPILRERSSQLAGSLSGGQQQMLAIGRALMGSPRLLLLDEPSLGLAPVVIGQVSEALAAINRSGLTILLVEQNARKALQITNRALVLDQGQIVLEGDSRTLAADEAVIAHYLGEPKKVA